MKKSWFKIYSFGFMLIAGKSMSMTPTLLITHNLTDVESNAYIAGTIPSPAPSKPNATNSVPWIVVKIACTGHIVEGTKCPALIKMATNTSEPVDLGEVKMDIKTGEITPKRLAANGYILTVLGPAEATLSKG